MKRRNIETYLLFHFKIPKGTTLLNFKVESQYIYHSTLEDLVATADSQNNVSGRKVFFWIAVISNNYDKITEVKIKDGEVLKTR